MCNSGLKMQLNLFRMSHLWTGTVMETYWPQAPTMVTLGIGGNINSNPCSIPKDACLEQCSMNTWYMKFVVLLLTSGLQDLEHDWQIGENAGTT